MPKYLRVALLAALSILLLSGTANALSVTWLDVELKMDGNTKKYRTTSSTVSSFLAEQDIVLGQFDTVSPDITTALVNSRTTRITIIPGFDITVDIDGSTQIMSVAVGTKSREFIRQLENQNNVSYVLAEVAAETLSPGQKLKLNQVMHEDQTNTIPLKYDTEIILDDQIELGHEQIEQPGVEGEMLILNSLTLVNGNIVNSQIMSKEIVAHPVNEIVRRGTKEPLPKVQTEVALRSYTQMLEMTATAYTAGFQCTGKHPGHPAYGLTASGIPVDHGIVAVDPRVIPLGTRLYIEGYGESLAADTGGAIVGNKIDLYHEHLDDAKRFGRRKVKVYILG